jgi:hypothetical protein
MTMESQTRTAFIFSIVALVQTASAVMRGVLPEAAEARLRGRIGEGVGVLVEELEREDAGDIMVVVDEECRRVGPTFYTAVLKCL